MTKTLLFLISIISSSLSYSQSNPPLLLTLEVMETTVPGVDSNAVVNDSANLSDSVVTLSTYTTDLIVIFTLSDTSTVSQFGLTLSDRSAELYSFSKNYSDNILTQNQSKNGENTHIKLHLRDISLPKGEKKLIVNLIGTSNSVINSKARYF